MKVLVILPYQDKLIRAMDDANRLELGNFILVGSKSRILEICFKENVQSSNFVIYDVADPMEATSFSKSLMEKENYDYLIFGDIPPLYRTKILDIKDCNDLGNIDIIDLPFLKHFLFVSNNSKHLNTDFDDKKKAIIQCEILMKCLNIKKANVALITNMSNKTDILEANIIKMILKDNEFSNINVYDSFNILTLFNKNTSVNIYNTNINLLIMRNYEASKIFVDTLNVFTNAKIANILITDHFYAVDADQLKDYHNILFSIMVLSKINKTERLSIPKKKCVI